MSEGALEFIRESGIEGNFFDTFSHGDQPIHAFHPRIRVAIESRIDDCGEGDDCVTARRAGEATGPSVRPQISWRTSIATA